jgi:hypothetical protein
MARLHVLRLERHPQGPRVYLLGRRVHEYHLGFGAAAAAPLGAVAGSLLAAGIVALLGLYLVVKDWPDLFAETRDKASWSLWIHRLPPGWDER